MAVDTTKLTDYLVWNVPIVDTNSGYPTPTFIRWFQQFRNGIGSAVTSTRKILTGKGLTGGGDLSEDRTISLDASYEDLNDVDMTGITNGQVPTWDDTAKMWKPGSGGGGGGGGGGGPGVLISDVVITPGTNTVNFTQLDASKYLHYVIEGSGLVASGTGGGAGSVSMQISTDGGVTYDTGNNYFYADTLIGSSGFQSTGSSERSGWYNLGGSADTNSYNGSAFRMELFDPGNASTVTQMVGQLALASTDGHNYNFSSAGRHNVAVAVNAIRFFLNATTWASGRIRIYGIPITAGGSGGGGMTLLDTVTAVGGEFSLEFATIPSIYKNLLIMGQGGNQGSSTSVSGQVSLVINSDTTGSNYGRTMYGWFGSGTPFGLNTADLFLPEMNASGVGAGSFRVDISNYTTTGQITWMAESAAIQQNTGIVKTSSAGVWVGPGPVTDIKLNITTADGYFAGTQFQLYGY